MRQIREDLKKYKRSELKQIKALIDRQLEHKEEHWEITAARVKENKQFEIDMGKFNNFLRTSVVYALPKQADSEEETKVSNISQGKTFQDVAALLNEAEGRGNYNGRRALLDEAMFLAFLLYIKERA